MIDQLARIEGKLDQFLTKGTEMAGELEALTAEVQHVTDVEESAIVLIQGLADQLKAAGTDPAKLAALTASLETEAAKLAAAITANTPAQP